MATDYETWFCFLTVFVSKSLCCIYETDWGTLDYTAPVTLNYNNLIHNSSVIRCIATCWPLFNWNQIYFQGEDCYCLAPVYAEVSEVSGTMTTISSIWTTYQDTNYCSEKGYTIFQDQGYCLKFFSTGESWDIADSRCQEDGGHLVTVNTKQDLTNLRSLYSQSTYVYVGAHRTLTGTEFVWITGGTVNESLWNPDEPNNLSGVEDCVELIENEKFNDISCNKFQPFICQILTH